MKRIVLALGLVGLGATVAIAAPQAPLQAPTQVPAKVVQAPVQSPTQSPVQKSAATTAQAATGYRTFSYQPGESYTPTSRTMSGSNRPSWMDAGSKAAGRY